MTFTTELIDGLPEFELTNQLKQRAGSAMDAFANSEAFKIQYAVSLSAILENHPIETLKKVIITSWCLGVEMERQRRELEELEKMVKE